MGFLCMQICSHGGHCKCGDPGPQSPLGQMCQVQTLFLLVTVCGVLLAGARLQSQQELQHCCISLSQSMNFCVHEVTLNKRFVCPAALSVRLLQQHACNLHKQDVSSSRQHRLSTEQQAAVSVPLFSACHSTYTLKKDSLKATPS